MGSATPRIQPAKVALHGVIVKTMTHARTDRGMRLIEFESRCIMSGELHELVTTDEPGLRAGDRVDRVGFLGFLEVRNAGVIERGDRFCIGETCLGTVLGFDDCHYPNHYNILIATPALLTAAQVPALRPGAQVSFQEAP